MTPETIITSELLAGLTKCPHCKAEPKEGWKEGVRWYECGTMIEPSFLDEDSLRADQTRPCVKSEVATFRARVLELEEALTRIANQDYRGNRSTESQIAFKALQKGTKP